jgi:hypothetical protein
MASTPHILTATRTTEVPPSFSERHYTIVELCKMWHLARATVRRWFDDEPGVVRIGVRRLQRGGKRARPVTLRIPESVALRVYRRHTEAAD